MKISSSLLTIISFLLILLSSNSLAFRQMDSHMHGEAELNIVIEGQTIQVDFTSPAMNLVGFEHKAKTKTEIQQIKTVIGYLKQAKWLQLNPRCTLQTSTASLHQEKGEEHAEFTAQYQFSCNTSQSVNSINLGIFSDYSGIHEIDVNLITPNKQMASELNHEQTTLNIK